MATRIIPLAGQPATAASLIDVAKLVAGYFTEVPDPSVPAQRVAFGTSGHPGSAFDGAFNEVHVLAITQAICDFRPSQRISGPLFLGTDTHALSQPACATALEVLAANGVDVMLAAGDETPPTPAISHAIVVHNRVHSRIHNREANASPGAAQADGIVITPSHNPPRNGGFNYNPPHGCPAGQAVTAWIETAANRLLQTRLAGVKRMPHVKALHAATTHRHDYLNACVGDLGQVIDMDVIRDAKPRIGADPLGGAGVHYWAAIAERYRLDLTVVSGVVDPTLRFMTLDWEGQIRMEPSSPYAMQRLQGMKDRFDMAFACDTDHDRHGIVPPGTGLLAPNHYLSVAIDYLFAHRPAWSAQAVVGKTVVSTRLIDRVAARHGRQLFEVPVGFKWFAAGLHDDGLCFCGEESAGASFLRRDGSVWTTDKDGIVAALLSAEITATRGRDPGALYTDLANEFGHPVAERVDAPASPEQKARLAALSPQRIASTALAGEEIQSIRSHAPGNGASIGGIKVSATSGWFAARPSGIEDIYKIYAERFAGPQHLQRVLEEAQGIVDAAISNRSGSGAG